MKRKSLFTFWIFFLLTIFGCRQTEIDETKSWINLSQSGQFAWAVTLWDLTTTFNDGTKCLIPLRCTWILEKMNGSWIIVHFHKSIGIKTIRDYAI